MAQKFIKDRENFGKQTQELEAKIKKTLYEVCRFASCDVETDGCEITKIFNGGSAIVIIHYPANDYGEWFFKIKYRESDAAKFQELLKDLEKWRNFGILEEQEIAANKAKTEKEIEKAYNEELKAAATEKYKSMSDAEKAALHVELENSGKKPDDFDKYSIWEIAKDLEKEARKISSYSPDAPDYEKTLKDASYAGYKIKINHKYFDLK